MGNREKSLFKKMKEERQVYDEQRGQDRQGGAGKVRRSKLSESSVVGAFCRQTGIGFWESLGLSYKMSC